MFVIKKSRQIKNISPIVTTDIPKFNEKAATKAEWTYYKKNKHPSYNLGIKESQNF